MPIIHALILVLSLYIVGMSTAHANVNHCPAYTWEQEELIHKAHTAGAEYGYGLTMAAIVVQESFWGRHIITSNPQDILPKLKDMAYPPQGSYGPTHILLSTAMELEGMDPTSIDDVLDAKEWMEMELRNNLDYAWQLTLRNLDANRKYLFGTGRPRTKFEWRTFWGAWNSRNNGPSSEYSKAIAKNVDNFIRCKTFSRE